MIETILDLNEERIILRRQLAELVRVHIEPQATQSDRYEKFNHALFQEVAKRGLLGANISEEYGGAGHDTLASVIINEELAKSDPAFTLSYLAHSVLFAHNLDVNGSEAQKRGYMQKVLSGEWRAGIAMTEPGAGSDVLAMKTKAEKNGSHWILNGSKTFITNYDGSVFLVYARTGEERNNISLFIVEDGFEGFERGNKIDKMGMKASPTGMLYFGNCQVPLGNIVGTENQALIPMMKNLEIERLTLSAISLGIAERCLDEMVRYAPIREQFGRPIIENGQIQEYISESYSSIADLKKGIYETAAKLDVSPRNSLSTNALKLRAAEVGEYVARKAIQVLGGLGYSREGKVERFFRDSILLAIGGGTNELMQRQIAFELAGYNPDAHRK